MTSFMTEYREYFASFFMALVTLKVVDANLDRVKTILKAAECDIAMIVCNYVKIFHDTTNTLRIEAVKNVGTPLARRLRTAPLPSNCWKLPASRAWWRGWLGLVGGGEFKIKLSESGKVKSMKNLFNTLSIYETLEREFT